MAENASLAPVNVRLLAQLGFGLVAYTWDPPAAPDAQPTYAQALKPDNYQGFYNVDFARRVAVVPGGTQFKVRLSNGQSWGTSALVTAAAAVDPSVPSLEDFTVAERLASLSADDMAGALFGRDFADGTQAGGLVAVPALELEGGVWTRLP